MGTETLLIVVVVGVYTLALVALAVYSTNYLYLTAVASRVNRGKADPPLPASLPIITVQLPIYNERFVAERIVDAAACLDWPRDRLEIQVLDDSTDATCEVAAQAVRRWQASGVNIHYIHRAHRQGYKAGALAAGLDQAMGSLIAVFDADFVPPPDFLRRTVGAFTDPQVGFVQARWDHLNRDTSLLTHLQSLSIDAHFIVEQLARSGKGYIMNFNGTAGVWRRAAIRDVGGWNIGSLTEDLDLSYRAELCGWKPMYLPDVTVPCELVASFSAYRKQQTRWAQGSIECARRLLPEIHRSRLPWPAKLQATLHLTGYLIQTLMLAASAIYPFLLLMPMARSWHVALFCIGILLTPATLAPTVLFIAAQRRLRPGQWRREIPAILALSVLGAGMTLNSTRALWKGLRAQPAIFERTPKWGLVTGQPDRKRTLYRVAGDWLVVPEIALAGLNLGSAVIAWYIRNPGIFANASLLAIGLAVVAGSTIWEMRLQRWGQAREATSAISRTAGLSRRRARVVVTRDVPQPE